MPTPEFIKDLRRHIGHDPLFLIGVTALVFREGAAGRELLMVRRSDTGEWSPVCGIVEPGQQVHEVCVREVREETRVDAEVERLIWICTHEPITYTNGDVCSYVNHTFVLRWTGGEPTVGDDESTDARWWPVAALPELRREFRERIEWALQDVPGVLCGGLPDDGGVVLAP